MRIATVVTLAGLLALPAADAMARQDPTPVAAAAESDVQAFRRLRAEALAAAEANDPTTAAARLAEADLRLPNHPGLIMMRARLAAAAGQPDEAMTQLKRYAGAGLVLNLVAYRALLVLEGIPISTLSTLPSEPIGRPSGQTGCPRWPGLRGRSSPKV